MVRIVLILGSAPMATRCRAWPRTPFTDIVVINNAWAVRDDWDILIHPDDFPPDRRPTALADGQRVVTSDEYVPVQNRFGGFVYAGGTMAFTAGYWALGALAPDVMAFYGCDMVYDSAGQTHFYGTGAADPLRADISLRNLEAKSARLMMHAGRLGCHAVNLSDGPSRLTFPRAEAAALTRIAREKPAVNLASMQAAEAREAELDYLVPDGRYWEVEDRFDPRAIDELDAMWLNAAQ